MDYAINELEIALKCTEENEPIQRVEGKVEQADRNLKASASYRQALIILNTINEGDTITISVERHADLIEAETILDALQAAGVDNWDGFEVVMDSIGEDFIDEES